MREAVFINRDATSMRSQTHRQALVEAYSNRVPANSEQGDFKKAFYQAAIQHISSQRSALARYELQSSLTRELAALSADPSLMLGTYSALLSEFQPSKAVGIFSADRVTTLRSKHYSNVATCVRALLPLAAMRIPMLDHSLFSLLALYYGLLHGDVGLVRIARSSYTSALSQYSRRLGTVMTQKTNGSSKPYQVFLCASIALQFFEHLNDIEVHGAGHLAHIDGALRFLQSFEPRAMQKSAGMRMAFSGLRGIVAFVAVERRKPSFLSEPEWLDLPYQGATKTTRDYLNDLGLLLPKYLKSADDVLSEMRDDVLTLDSAIDRCQHLLNEMSSFQRQFDRWLYLLTLEAPGHLYWALSDPIVESVDYQDPECERKYSNSFHQQAFASAPVAGLLIHYWSFQLELLMTTIQLQEAVIYYSSKQPSIPLPTSQITESNLRRDRARAEEAAQLILQAEPQLSSCFEGLVCVQSPLRIVTRYFEQD